ncbi:uncharacterized protein LOC112504274 [Cynara cardunculus var. scolymus]|uniref:uncharacterized protein LOC112504274 n=1 Tax=Cynara cardunculus var. scolymus TaxID=59895 RepID=UPI000D62A442|nr:uncharacterized protein LOC112504274 [Cynara cardunculus var. scolymus]
MANRFSKVKRRLPTQVRLHWKDEPPDLECSLCGQCLDSHDHLFFQCPFAGVVWNSVLFMVDLTGMPSRWEQIVQVISDSNSRPKLLKQKIVVAAAVYYIWQERNRRLFSATKRTAQDLIAVIRESIFIRADWLASRPVVTYG